MSSTQPTAVSEYRLAPMVMARFVGVYLILLAVVLLAATVAAATFDLSLDLLVALLGLGVLGLIGLGWWLNNKLVVVRLTTAGYQVRLIRAAGVAEANWSEVEDAVAASPRDIECIVVRLRDGRSTTIPVQLVAADKDDLARDIRDHLRGNAR